MHFLVKPRIQQLKQYNASGPTLGRLNQIVENKRVKIPISTALTLVSGDLSNKIYVKNKLCERSSSKEPST
jgi:hypothetical protein